MESLIAFAAGPSINDAQQAFFGFGSVVFAFAAGAALIVSLLGILTMTLVVAPNLTQRFSTALRERNVSSFFVGIPVFLLFGGLVAVSLPTPPMAAVAICASAVTLILAFASAAEDIGRRLSWACGREGSRASHLTAGWLIFSFGALFPIIGWFIILPYVSLSGLGSLVIGTFRKKQTKEIAYPGE